MIKINKILKHVRNPTIALLSKNCRSICYKFVLALEPNHNNSKTNTDIEMRLHPEIVYSLLLIYVSVKFLQIKSNVNNNCLKLSTISLGEDGNKISLVYEKDCLHSVTVTCIDRNNSFQEVE